MFVHEQLPARHGSARRRSCRLREWKFNCRTGTQPSVASTFTFADILSSRGLTNLPKRLHPLHAISAIAHSPSMKKSRRSPMTARGAATIFKLAFKLSSCFPDPNLS